MAALFKVGSIRAAGSWI